MAQLALQLGGNWLASGGNLAVAAGMTAAQAIDHRFGKKPFIGPRLSDLSTQNSVEGSAIPEIYALGAVAGCIIWSTGKTEHISDDDGGKLGPPPAQSATYTCSYASLLGHQPEGNRATRPVKIWFNQHLKYAYEGGDETGFSFTYSETEKCWSAKKKGTSLRFYTGAQNLPDSLIEAKLGVGETPAYVDRCYLVIENLELSEFGNDPPNVRVLYQTEIGTVGEAVVSICTQANLAPGDVSPAFLSDQEFGTASGVLGFIRAGVTPGRELLDQIGTLFSCDFPPIDGKITAVPRAGAPVLSVSERHGRWSYAGQTYKNVFARQNDRELPERTEMAFLDPHRRYTASMRRGRRLTTPSRVQGGFSVPAVLEGKKAQTVADIETWRAVIESVENALSLSWEHLWLAPCDKIEVSRETPVGNVSTLFRLTTRNAALLGPLDLRLVAQDDRLFSHQAEDDSSFDITDTVDVVGAPILFLSESVVLSQDAPDMISAPGFLAAITMRKDFKWEAQGFDAQYRATGITVWKKSDHHIISQPATLGYLREDYTVGDNTAGYDPAQAMKVAMFRGELSTASDVDELAQGANLMQFETALCCSFLSAAPDGLDNDGGVIYDLSTIKDARFGSDDLAPAGTVIPAGTRFVLMRDAEGKPLGGTRWVSCSASRLGQDLRISVFNDGTGVTRELPGETYHARNMEAPSPDVSLFKRTGGDLRITGSARTRQVEDNTDSNAATHLPVEPQFAGRYKYRLRLESPGGFVETDLFSSDEHARFDFTVSASDLAAMPGGTPAAGALSGTLALYGKLGPGRAAMMHE